MKSPGGSKSGSFPTGPSLTPKQKAERDRAEAANARTEAQNARIEARSAGELAREEEARAKADRAKGEYKYAREETREARHNLARERRDLARAARDQARARRDRARARTAGLARPSVSDGWILGGNDRWLTCAATAVANSLLLATGKRVSDEDVLALHEAAAGSPDAGASVLSVLEAAQEHGLAGVRLEDAADLLDHLQDIASLPVVAFADFPGAGDEFLFAGDLVAGLAPVDLGEQAPGHVGTGRELRVEPGLVHPLIVETALPGGIHAVLLGDGFTVTWGQAVEALPGQVLAAWPITWG